MNGETHSQLANFMVEEDPDLPKKKAARARAKFMVMHPMAIQMLYRNILDWLSCLSKKLPSYEPHLVCSVFNLTVKARLKQARKDFFVNSPWLKSY